MSILNSSKIYVGNLSWGIDTDKLKQAFEEFGTVTDAIVVTDRQTGRSRGFGFVEFDNSDDAQKAIDAMNGKELDGRELVVNFAKAREE